MQAKSTLILSDLHLGADTSQARWALDVLESTPFDRLILLGDIFADLNFRRLSKDHWKFLSHIRKLSNPKRGIEVVWVEGNHDQGLAELMSHLVGVPVYQEYEWSEGGKQHLAIHGHQFDRFAINNLVLSRIGEVLYLLLQKFDHRSKLVSRYLDRLNTRWLRLTTKVANGALAHAREKGVARIFCGHTHVSLRVERDGIEYFNSGSWVDSKCTYITVDEQGARIHEYQPRAEHRDSGEEREPALAAPLELVSTAGLSIDPQYEDLYC